MKDKYVLVGRVNKPHVPVREEGRFSFPLVGEGDDMTMIERSLKIFEDQFNKLLPGQSVVAWLCKNGTGIKTFKEKWKE